MLFICGVGVKFGEEVVSGGRYGVDVVCDSVVGWGVGGVNGV